MKKRVEVTVGTYVLGATALTATLLNKKAREEMRRFRRSVHSPYSAAQGVFCTGFFFAIWPVTLPYMVKRMFKGPT